MLQYRSISHNTEQKTPDEGWLHNLQVPVQIESGGSMFKMRGKYPKGTYISKSLSPFFLLSHNLSCNFPCSILVVCILYLEVICKICVYSTLLDNSK